MTKSLAVKLELTLPKGNHSLQLYIIRDSYTSADHNIDLETIEVLEVIVMRMSRLLGFINLVSCL